MQAATFKIVKFFHFLKVDKIGDENSVVRIRVVCNGFSLLYKCLNLTNNFGCSDSCLHFNNGALS